MVGVECDPDGGESVNLALSGVSIEGADALSESGGVSVGNWAGLTAGGVGSSRGDSGGYVEYRRPEPDSFDGGLMKMELDRKVGCVTWFWLLS